MKCSVIIPCKNRKQQLTNTLSRLQRQTLNSHDYEVILIEDGSADYSQALLEQQFVFNNIKYLTTGSQSIGSAKARNLGLQYATGDVVVFLDCDMLVNEQFLENHCAFHQSLPPDTKILQIGLRKMLTPECSTNLPEDLNHLKIHEDYSPEARHYIFQLYSENLSNYLSGWFYAFSCNLSVKRSVLLEFGGFDENFFGWGLEDNELGYRLAKNGILPMVNPAVEACHQFHGPEVTAEKIDGPTTNLDYFCNKYNDVPVTLFKALSLYQRSFADELDTITPTLFQTRTHQFFDIFEKSLRLYDIPAPATNTCITLTNPTVHDIDQMLLAQPDAQLIVLCAHESSDVIIRCHCHDRRDQIFLYRV